MPELPEVEVYRRLAERALGRRIVDVDTPDDWYLKRGLTASAAQAALVGRHFGAARRTGKLLLLDTGGDGPVLGLRFGMSGRLLVDGTAAVDNLVYASNRELEKWDRFAVRFADDGDLRVRDPRRLGGVELDPDEGRLGPEAPALTAESQRSAKRRNWARVACMPSRLWPARSPVPMTTGETRTIHRGLRSIHDSVTTEPSLSGANSYVQRETGKPAKSTSNAKRRPRSAARTVHVVRHRRQPSRF